MYVSKQYFARSGINLCLLTCMSLNPVCCNGLIFLNFSKVGYHIPCPAHTHTYTEGEPVKRSIAAFSPSPSCRRSTSVLCFRDLVSLLWSPLSSLQHATLDAGKTVLPSALWALYMPDGRSRIWLSLMIVCTHASSRWCATRMSCCPWLRFSGKRENKLQWENTAKVAGEFFEQTYEGFLF